MRLAKTFQDLRRQIATIRREAHLDDERRDAFPYWFCQATLADPDDDALIKRALIGGKNDHNIDILLISELSQTVYICQTKYREHLRRKSESPNEVRALAHAAEAFGKRSTDFRSFFSKASTDVSNSLEGAWELVNHHRYRLQTIFVTTGKVSQGVIEEAQGIVRDVRTPGGRLLNIEYLVYDGRDCCRMQIDLEDLVPAIPFIEFGELDGVVRIKGANDRLYCYVCSVPTREVHRVFREHGERLFARNVRLGKGDATATNQEIRRSLERYPTEFFYLNNGLTILGSRAQSLDQTRLRVYNPQIINGQQTTRMIAKNGRSGSGASVLAKVILRTGESDQEFAEIRQFVQRVVRATNFQNPIKLSELAANRPEHVRLERAFRSLGWQYIRKRGKRDPRAGRVWAGMIRPYGKFTLQELTTALVACLHDPQYIRLSGIEQVFEQLFREEEENLYEKLFPAEGREAEENLFCVLCYFLATKRLTTATSIRRTVENHGTYYVAYRLHQALMPLFRDGRTRKSVMRALGAENRSIQYSKSLASLRKAIGESWQLWFRASGDGDIRGFVGSEATKSRWNSWFEDAKRTARYRHTVSDALGELRSVCLSET